MINFEKEQRVNIDINKQLWKKVGIECAKMGVTKKFFVQYALEKLLEEINIKEKFKLK